MPRSPVTVSRISAYLESRVFVGALYLALACVMTYPLVLNFASALPAGSGDIWQNYWNFWWWKKALLELQQHPYHTQFLFHPSGVDLIFHTHSSFNMLVGLPVTAIFGPGAAYNFCVLLALWLSALGAYLLVSDLSGDARGGFLAGLVFSFFPHHIEQTFEHLNLISTQFIPLTLFYFLRLSRDGGWKNIAGSGACFMLNALCSWHLGLKLVLVLAAFSILMMVRAPRPRLDLLRDYSLAGLLAALLTLPAAGPLIREMASGETYYQKPPQNLGIDPLYLFIPHYGHSLWGRLTAEAYVERAYSAAGFLSYLGFTPMALGLLALFRRTKGSGPWAGFTLAALLLALGAHPYWNGELISTVTLPFALLEKIPLFNLMRVANRFLILASLGLAVLAGLGWGALKRKTELKFVLLAAMICLEYSWLPYPIRKLDISPIYEQLARTGPSGAVIDVPSLQRSRAAHNMVAQTVHNRPIADGYVSVDPPKAFAFIESDPALSDLLGTPPKYERPIDRRHLVQLGFDTFVLHKYRADSYGKKRQAEVEATEILERRFVSRLGGVPDELMAGLRQELTEICGEPVFEDDQIVVFYLEGRAQ